MRILFMGTPDIAAGCLQKLIDDKFEIIGVVTQPDKPQNRGKKLGMPPVKELALKYDLPVYQPLKARDEEFVKTLQELNPDVIVVVAFGQILPKSILDIPKLGCVNVHVSLLPKYRGAAPIQWSIINGDTVTGITTMYMDAGMDTGDMIEKFEVQIDDKDTYGTLYEKMKVAGGNAIIHTIERIADPLKLKKEKQPDTFTMAPMIEKEMGEIDWNKTSKEIRNLIRGLNPMPGAYTMITGERMKIWSAEFTTFNDENCKPGQIVKADSKSGLLIKTGDGILEITELQMPNLKRMSERDYLRGHKINF